MDTTIPATYQWTRVEPERFFCGACPKSYPTQREADLCTPDRS